MQRASGNASQKTIGSDNPVVARMLKLAVTWAYGWHLISPSFAQRIIDRFKLWND